MNICAIITMLLTLLPCCSHAARVKKHVATGVHMGTEFRITLYTSDPLVAKRALQAAFSQIEQLDETLSNYRADSELSVLCRSAPHAEPVEVSDALWRVLSRSQRLAGRSGGAFDVTIGTFTKQWRRARRRGILPTTLQLEQAATVTGYHHLYVDPECFKVQLLLENMQLDLGGIAKGYAADVALSTLKDFGITQASVDAGGDLVVGDPPPGKTGWKIAIASLEADEVARDFVNLTNAAIATSGDLWQFIEIDGVRYSHIIDPQTGMGLTQRRSATVIAVDGMTADGLASALCVLGPRRGIQLVEETPRVAGRMLVHDGNQLRQFWSAEWKKRWPVAKPLGTESVDSPTE